MELEYLGRRLYYDKTTGEIIVDTRERVGHEIQRTIEQDFESYSLLKERTPETVGVIELEYGENSEDFKQAIDYKVNPETLEVEFLYGDDEEPEEPVFQPPLTQQLKELKDKYAALEEESTVNQFALMELHMMILEMQNGGEAV